MSFLKRMLVPMVIRTTGAGGAGGGGGGPPTEIDDDLGYALQAGYGVPSGGWMPNNLALSRAQILNLISGGL